MTRARRDWPGVGGGEKSHCPQDTNPGGVGAGVDLPAVWPWSARPLSVLISLQTSILTGCCAGYITARARVCAQDTAWHGEGPPGALAVTLGQALWGLPLVSPALNFLHGPSTAHHSPPMAFLLILPTPQGTPTSQIPVSTRLTASALGSLPTGHLLL